MSKRWKPNNSYYIIDIAGNVNMYTWADDDVDVLYHKFGNCFETREQAETASAKVKELLLSMSGETETSSVPLPKLPKLTKEVFDLPECPEWAEYAAVDVQGLTYWYQNRPLADERIGIWCNLKNERRLIPQLFDSSDWWESLIERPKKSFPKLTEEVFARPDCPEWAKYAAVGNSGYAYWFKDKPLPGIDRSTISILVSWTEYDIKQLIPGLWDSSDWQNSLIERPKPKLTTEVFNRSDCPKTVQYAVVTSEGRVVGYTSKPYINKEYDCWGFNEGCSFTISAVGTFDSTDWQNSLVERPIKLPDWCEAGEWAYSTEHAEYVRIKDIDEFDVEFSNGFYCTVSHKAFAEDYKQARPRPYNAEEMQKLVGKVLELDGNRDLVTSYDEDSGSVYADAMWMNSDELLSNGYTIDGEICGKLEHLEDGEWVE